MIDDDEEIALDTGRTVLCRDLTDGQIVYCPACETALNKNAGRMGASASCIERVNGQIIIYCFNCSCLTAVNPMCRPIGVCGGERGGRPARRRPQLNWNGRQDSSFDGDYRLFLDSPMGTGKNHAIREYLREIPGLSVLSITFRQSLARYLARELGLECYLDNGFWREDSKDRRRRCVMCLDSVYKLGSVVDMEPYDLVVIDECVFVEYHFLADTITNRLPEILRTFQGLLHDARRVICMQHLIPDTAIAFYMNCMKLGAGSRDVVRRKGYGFV
ncbi:hypothetical protein V1515DRAFT_623635 [Lipomyces mesembrius]